MDNRTATNYGYIRQELMRSTLVLVAVLGSIGLAWRYPETFGQAAVANLGATIGGYWGLEQARRNTPNSEPTCNQCYKPLDDEEELP